MRDVNFHILTVLHDGPHLIQRTPKVVSLIDWIFKNPTKEYQKPFSNMERDSLDILAYFFQYSIVFGSAFVSRQAFRVLLQDSTFV